MSGATRVLLVDDHAMLREMLRERLQREADLEVVGVAARGEDAVALAAALSPDIVVLDIDMPGQLCFTAAREIRAAHPQTRILFLSAFFHDRYIEDALEVGASGYVTKDESPEVIVGAIRTAAGGLAYYSPNVQSRIVVGAEGLQLAQAGSSRAAQLTPRELEVVRYIARGLANKEIASRIDVTVKTVDRHTQNAMDKLDIHNRVELARFAIREGLAEA